MFLLYNFIHFERSIRKDRYLSFSKFLLQIFTIEHNNNNYEKCIL